MRVILHIDFNSYFATVEQQANPRLRGKPIGVTGGDRQTRTVLSTASVEAKKLGVKTGMQIWEAKRICPSIVIIPGDSDKYLSCSKKFWNILKDYSPGIEIFSIDEVFLELNNNVIARGEGLNSLRVATKQSKSAIASLSFAMTNYCLQIAREIKQRIGKEIGEWITVSIGISYNKLMAKLASDLQKPDGLVVIATPERAIEVLDQAELDDICGIGPRIKKRLFQMGIDNFKKLRQVPKDLLVSSFNSYGETLYNMGRGVDFTPIKPFYERGEVKSIGHRHTIDHDISSPEEIKQILFKISEMIASRLRHKKLVGKTIHCWYRGALPAGRQAFEIVDFKIKYHSDGMQLSRDYTADGLEIFKSAWKIFLTIWREEKIRMIGASISNLKPLNLQTISFLPEKNRQEKIITALDKINDKFGEFTLQRGVFLGSSQMKRKPNPYLSDRRFKI